MSDIFRKEWEVHNEVYDLLHNSYILIKCEGSVVAQVPCFDNEPMARAIAQHIVDNVNKQVENG